MSDLALALPDELLDEIARRVADLITTRQPTGPEAWLSVDQAAEHLGYATNPQRGRRRIYDLTAARHTNGFPSHKDGSRLIFRASELDAWLNQQEDR
jgi:hypothetical protein